MYIFRLGIISTLLSETFVNGFTTGAAVQVLISQVFDIFGLNSVKPRGYFKFIKVMMITKKIALMIRLDNDYSYLLFFRRFMLSSETFHMLIQLL